MKKLLQMGTVLVVMGVLATPATAYAYENLSLGEEILINGYSPDDFGYSEVDGSFSIALDGFHFVDDVSSYQDPGVGVVGVLLTVNNIDAYETYLNDNAINPYDISSYVTVKDGDDFNCEFYNLDAPADGKYQIGKDIDIGSKARVCMTYFTDTDMKDFTIILNDQYSINVSLDENGEGVFLTDSEETEAEEGSTESSEVASANKEEPVVLYDQDGYKVEVSDFDFRKNTFQIKLTNLTHHDVRVSTVDGYVNGVMNNIDYSERITSGKSGIGTAKISKSELVDAGIDAVEDVSFNIRVDDVDNSGNLATIGSMHFSISDGAIDASIVYSDSDTIKQVQEMLNQLGYDCGSADGIAGKNTNNQILQFESDHGLKETTDITDDLLNALKALVA